LVGGRIKRKDWDPGLERERTGEKQKLGLVRLRISQSGGKGSNPSLRLRGELMRNACSFLIDSGATGDFVSWNFIRKHHLGNRCSALVPALEIEMADGTIYTSNKVVRLAEIVGEKNGEFSGRRDLIVLPLRGYDAILGMPWLEEVNPDIDWDLRVIRPRQRPQLKEDVEEHIESEGDGLSEADKKRLDESLVNVDPVMETVIRSYAHLFREDLPPGLPMKRPIEHSIELLPDSQPVYMKQYRVSIQDQTEIDRQVEEHLAAGRLKRSTSSFNAPTLLVGKPDNTKRMCQDERGLNKITIKNRMDMPNIQGIFDRLKGSVYFSKLDLKSGFNQIRINEKDTHKTGFSCSSGHYEWLVMPFGLCNAPATFQSLMQFVLAERLNKSVVVFIDDILIYTKTKEDHLKEIEWVLQQLDRWKLYAAAKKCFWMKEEMEFLGHVVSAKGVQVMAKKIQSIVDWPELSNAKEVKQFLGLAGYYRRFVKDFSKIAASLTELMKEKTTWRWEREEKDAFKQLKEKMSQTPILIHPDHSLPFVVTTDASGYAVGAVLSQDQGNGQQPVAFYSHKMNKAERNYPVHEQELLAIILALKEWRCYLHGASHAVQIITDHQSLKYLNSQPHLSSRQARWVEYLQQFDIVISYREGKENVVADALSRRGDYKKDAEAEEEKEKREFGSSVPRLKYRIAAITAIEDGDPVLLAELSEATKEDISLRDIVTNPQQHGYSMTEEGILKNQQGLIVIPNRRSLRMKIMKEFHDVPVSGHRGVEKTLSKVGKLFWWPGIRQEVQQYIGSCIACQSNKSSNKATAGLLHPLPIPSHAWESISMDFVGPLPVTKDGHDNILVVVDRLTKMVHLTACRITITAPQVASIIWREIIRHHGVPISIVSDRDPRFTSHFWDELWKLMGTNLHMSTAYHPQTDGQTERTNRTMEEILRNYVSDKVDDWDKHLTAVEISINNSQQSSTKFTPFYLNHGRDMKLPIDVAVSRLDTSINPSAAESIKQLNDDVEKAKAAIEKAQIQQAKYANEHRRLAHEYQIGDRVMLSTEDMKQFGGKLVSKYVGPLKVLQVSEDKTVTLELPVNMRAKSNKFNIGKVKLYVPSKFEFPGRQQQDRPPPELIEGEEEYEVEQILGKREVKIGRNRHMEYLVKWLGYSITEATWQAANQLENAAEAVEEFESQQN
jgi:uncharacterized protein with von Willebrand factor type A (vWA) domain